MNHHAARFGLSAGDDPSLAALPPKARAVVVLRYWEDLSVEQVAFLLGCSPSRGTMVEATAVVHAGAVCVLADINVFHNNPYDMYNSGHVELLHLTASAWTRDNWPLRSPDSGATRGRSPAPGGLPRLVPVALIYSVPAVPADSVSPYPA